MLRKEFSHPALHLLGLAGGCGCGVFCVGRGGLWGGGGVGGESSRFPNSQKYNFPYLCTEDLPLSPSISGHPVGSGGFCQRNKKVLSI